MEFKEYLKILRKNLTLIVIATFVVALVAYIFSIKQTNVYEANSSLTIVPKPALELKNVYEYDGYYALQAATLFGNTVVVGWLQSPDIILEIYKRAGYDPGVKNSKALSKLIKATPVPDSFAIRFQLKESDKEKVLKVAQSTIEVIKDKVAEFNQKAGTKSNFEIVAAEPVVIEIRPDKGFNTLVGAALGLIFGIFLAFVVEYFRKS